MGEFINMTCPSCGGQLQAQKNMQKIYCMHCGTELLLKQDHEGVLITIKARDLQASAKLKEMQFSASALEMLKMQINELEAQVKQIRNSLLKFCDIYTYRKYYSKYEKEQNLPVSLRSCHDRSWSLYVDRKGSEPDDWLKHFLDSDIPGYTKADDLMNLLEFLEKPEYDDDKNVKQMLLVLEPLRATVDELKKKKAQLNRILDQAINNQ